MGWIGVIDRVWDRVRVGEMVVVTVGVIFFDGKIKTENGILFQLSLTLKQAVLF